MDGYGTMGGLNSWWSNWTLAILVVEWGEAPYQPKGKFLGWTILERLVADFCDESIPNLGMGRILTAQHGFSNSFGSTVFEVLVIYHGCDCSCLPIIYLCALVGTIYPNFQHCYVME